MKTKLKLLLSLTVIIFSYVAIIASWSWLSFDHAMLRFPTIKKVPLSTRQREILLKVEDPTFPTHIGLSLSTGQGFATITSAVARDVYLYDEPSDGVRVGLQRIFRGVFECCKKIDVGRDVMALVLNKRLPKESQLGIYSEVVYFGTLKGRQIHGFEDTA